MARSGYLRVDGVDVGKVDNFTITYTGGTTKYYDTVGETGDEFIDNISSEKIDVTGTWEWTAPLSGFFATAATPYVTTYPWPEENKRKEDMMTVFKIYIVDALELEMVEEYTAIAENQTDAMASVELPPEVRKGLKTKRYRTVVKAEGEFQRYRKKDE